MIGMLESIVWYLLMALMNIMLLIAFLETLKDRSKNAFKGILILVPLISFLLFYAYMRDFRNILGKNIYGILFNSTERATFPEIDEKSVQLKIDSLEKSLLLLSEQTEKVKQNKSIVEGKIKALKIDDVEKIKSDPIGMELYRQFKLNHSELAQNQIQHVKISKTLDDLKRLQRQLQNKEIIQKADLGELESMEVLKTNLSLSNDKPSVLLDMQMDNELDNLLTGNKNK